MAIKPVNWQFKLRRFCRDIFMKNKRRYTTSDHYEDGGNRKDMLQRFREAEANQH